MEFLTLLTDPSSGHQSLGLISNITAIDWLFLAQQVQDAKVLDQIQTAFNNFIQSGQAWAMAFGIVFGYVFRVFTGPS